jgi:hypothetical protein
MKQLPGTFEIQKCGTPIILSRNKTINTAHNKLQVFLKFLELRIIGSAASCGECALTAADHVLFMFCPNHDLPHPRLLF